MGEAQKLTEEFVANNLRQIRDAGAGALVSACVGCDMIYQRMKPTISQEVMWYPTLLARIFQGGRLEMQADYYPGCHRLYRRLCQTPVDLDSPLQILHRIEGLRLNPLDAKLCCTSKKHLELLKDSIKNHTVITLCGACTINLREALKDRADCRVLMLPQVVWASVGGNSV
jgi:hypothetical protein